ncbi:MAG TPA: divergent polysaccharide deacetylase family protein, partial [Alphaproteobacteria bacterium]|nr:divergent polysaccharide deacetylase family protein [Alphaproteobacteria bacterium]
GSRRSMIAGLAGQIDMPFIVSDRRIDVEPDAAYIGRQLAELEAVAIDRGFAVGVGSPYPVTVETLTTWAAGLAQRGIVLVPVSAGVR